MTAPEPEDWGWYSYVQWEGRSYLVGASVDESFGGDHEWHLQIDKLRTFKERLLGRAKMSADDPCFLYFRAIIDEEPAFTDVSVEAGARNDEP